MGSDFSDPSKVTAKLAVGTLSRTPGKRQYGPGGSNSKRGNSESRTQDEGRVGGSAFGTEGSRRDSEMLDTSDYATRSYK